MITARRILILFVPVILFCSDSQNPQAGGSSDTESNIYGRVIDNHSRPVPGALIHLFVVDAVPEAPVDSMLNVSLVDTTDSDGIFNITDISQGEYRIIARHVYSGTNAFIGPEKKNGTDPPFPGTFRCKGHHILHHFAHSADTHDRNCPIRAALTEKRAMGALQVYAR
ncbi:MAG: hypothetical protein GF350_13585 [Chitinivibrionales bacterium]|nr:hypothetical protein [Chitinivibrionales bacterium]